MNVIPPIDITDARLTSSTIAEPDTGETAWSGAAVAYAVGDQRIRATTHRIYECIAAHTSAASPVPENNEAQWLEIGPTNKWAMFDTLRNTASVKAASITAVLTPGRRVDAIALLGLVADTATVSMTSDAVEVYSRTESLIYREVGDWYDYFFAAFRTKPSIALFDLPPYTSGVITVELTKDTGDVECGACVAGSAEFIGDVQYEAESDVLNFSTVNRDSFGGISAIVQRRNVPKTIQSIFVDKARVNRVRALRDDLAATPAVWAGLSNSSDGYFEAVLILGFYKRFSINLRHPEHAVIGLELEEI
ncbi:hypothetical protein [Limnobacter sp.]|uniref:hypothetical protein n=1 Tax=Limnobacter sp. TaxID=2003368 RepID=UPI002734CF79|nr:hypothetical protein [Limnobacter sp.]MDP3270677.1 hypothetical protein [Limnobacter sp.]